MWFNLPLTILFNPPYVRGLDSSRKAITWYFILVVVGNTTCKVLKSTLIESK